MGILRLADPIPASNRIGGFAIGCQAWCFNRYTVFEAIEKTAAAGGKVIEFFPGQKVSAEMTMGWGPDAPADAVSAVKAKLEKHGVRAVAFGVTGLGKDAAANRKTFEFARTMGLVSITSEPDAAAMDDIEKLVKEFDIMLAIHNHPRQANNPNYKYWDPEYVLSLVKGRDPRMGACADTGHMVRSGLKPVEVLRLYKDRVISLHLKDLDKFSPGGVDVPYGTGVSDVPGILKELRGRKFQGPISIEYENNWDFSVPEIAQCIGFVRGWTEK
jgi:sugar phosphate isomerase/epimerase